MKVALVVDWLCEFGGGERVLKAVNEIYPDADLFAVVDFMPRNYRYLALVQPFRKTRTTFIQRIPFAKKFFKKLLPLMPIAIEQLDLRDYDLIVSLSHSVAKGILTHPEQLHLCYCHSPMRYAWSLYHEYQEELGPVSRILSKIFLHRLRSWDVVNSNSVDAFAANSESVARRIFKYYRRDSEVIYPPVFFENIEEFQKNNPIQDVEAITTRSDPMKLSEDFPTDKEALRNDFGEFSDDLPIEKFRKDFSYFVTASRLVKYKKVGEIAMACTETQHRLLIVGEGPEGRKIRSISKKHPNVEFLGFLNEKDLKNVISGAEAFIFAANDDFGIAPVEAMVLGVPVIAYNKGGATESVIPGKTGIFFDEQNARTIARTLESFDRKDFDSKFIREHALKFSKTSFKRKFRDWVERNLEKHGALKYHL